MDDRGPVIPPIRIVGILLVHNEDVFVEQAIRNVAAFCDRIHVADHMSTDGTWEIVQGLGREYDWVEPVRIRHTGESHGLVQGYAGTDTWVLGVDGDELYDPEGLVQVREELLAGAYRDTFLIKSNVLNCVELDRERGRASGYLSPPSRSITKLYNCATFESWTHCYRQYFHDGETVFRPGYSSENLLHLGERTSWDESTLRCLHMCFLRRSSLDPEEGVASGRLSPIELGGKRRSRLAGLTRAFRSPVPFDSEWKQDKYRRGELVQKDASPFLRVPVGSSANG